MLSNVSVKNYKCIKELTLEKVAKFNLITGANNSGKSSLLEALFYVAGGANAANTLKVTGFRGLGDVRFPLGNYAEMSNAIEELFLEPMFYNLDKKLIINITSLVDDRTQKIELFLRDADYSSIPVEMDGEPEQLTLPLRYQYHHEKKDKGKEYVLKFRSKEHDIFVEPTPKAQTFPGHYITQRHYSGGDDAAKLGDLIASGEFETYDIVSILRKIEPRLESITSLPKTGGLGMIYCKIKGIKKMLPIVYLGDGIRRLLGMAIRVIGAQGGILFIDEIESGFHYSAYGDMWTSIVNLAKRTNTQIFATTHSDECLTAAYKVFNNSDEKQNFILHRMTNIEGKIQAKSFWGNNLENAIDFGFELR